MKKNLFIITLAVLACNGLVMAGERASAGNVYHVVVFWLKDPGNAEHREALINTTHSFSAIPGIIAVSAGTPLASDRAVVDDSFDVAITITLKDETALQTYQEHPIHVKAKEEKLKKLVKKFIVYDYID